MLSDGEDCWMAEPSGLSADDSPAQRRQPAAHGERAGVARAPSPEVTGPARWDWVLFRMVLDNRGHHCGNFQTMILYITMLVRS